MRRSFRCSICRWRPDWRLRPVCDEEAWHAITLNPARSLGIDARVGSLEPGKDADLVLWTADPLTTIGGEAWMTFVNGEVVYRAE